MASTLASLAGPPGILLGWSLFAGTHLVLSHPPIRSRLIEGMGKQSFLGLYSLISLATLIPTTIVYARYGRGKGASLFNMSRGTLWTGRALKYAAALTFAGAISSPSPIIAKPDGTRDMEAARNPKGMNRVTRHGTFLAFALLGLGQALTRNRLGDVLYWTAYPVFWLVGSLHQDARLRMEMPREFFDKTSLVPFWAIVQGRNEMGKAVKEMSAPALVAAAVAPLFVL